MNNADIVFYQQYPTLYFGVLSITSCLQHNKLISDVVIDNLENNSIETLKKLNPKLIAISVLSTEHNWLMEKSRLIKQALPETTIIAGGVHAMFYPYEILSESAVDLVCNSEGEEVTIKVIAELKKALPDWSSIKGLAYRDAKGKILINERADLVSYNDEIVEDRSVYYDRYPQLAEDTVHKFFSSRGCPYRCSFCYNANIHDIFKGKGQYIRQKSPENLIQEIFNQVNKYNIKSIYFYDDLFTFNKEWLKSFLELYKNRINLPFICTTRANLMDEGTAKLLSEAGCHTISFGVENGNYEIRKNVLNKNITDEQIIQCGLILKKYGIKTQTSNMFCLPEEKVDDAFKTIELNIKAKTNFVITMLFMPFPGTEITNYCIEKGLLDSDYSLKKLPKSFLTASILNIPDKNIIKNIHYLAFYFVNYPLFYKLFRKIVYFKLLTPVFYYLFLTSNIIRHKQEKCVSWQNALIYAWRLRKSV